MKRLCLALFLVAAAARGQYTDFAHHATATAGHANGLPAAAYPALCSSVAATGNFIYYAGTCWQTLATPADGTYGITFTGGVPSYGAVGGAPTTATYLLETANGTLTNSFAMGSLATGIVINTTTTGVPTIMAAQTCTNQFVRSYSASGQATCASVANSDLAGSIALSKFATQAAFTFVMNDTSGSAAPTAVTTQAVGSALNVPSANPAGVTDIFDDCLTSRQNNTTTIGCNTLQGAVVSTGAAVNKSNATSSVLQGGATHSVQDVNHHGVIECQAGTTATPNACWATTTVSADGVTWQAGDTIDGMVYGDTVSDGTNTYTDYFGSVSTFTGSAPTTGVFMSNTNGTNSGNWVLNVCQASTCSTANSSTAMNTLAWRAYRISYDGTNFHFYDCGATWTTTPTCTEMANSPVANTHIPTTPVTPFAIGIIKTAGTTNRAFALDWYHYYNTGIAR